MATNSSKSAPSSLPAHAQAVEESTGFASVLASYSASYASELKAKRARLDELIGEAHWLSVGTYKEGLLRTMLRQRVPRAFEVSTGFVIAQHEGKRLRSDQIDVLVWDAASHAPLFRDGEFVIVPPEAVRAVVEVKGRLTQTEVGEALANLEKVTILSRFVRQFGPARPPFRALFAYTRKEKDGDNSNYVSWPTTVYNSLWKHYQGLADADYAWPLCERLEGARSMVPGMFGLPWIDMVCILGVGVVALEEWTINQVAVPTYAGYDADPENDLSYNALEKELLLRLLAPRGLYTYDRPGHVSTLVSEKVKRSSPPYLPLEPPPESVESIGRLDASAVSALAGAHHRPRGAGWAGSTDD